MRAPSVFWFAVLLAVPAAAQDRQPHRVEIDGLVGYTAVNADKWARLGQPDELSRLAGGVVARALLFHISTTHVGFEIGTERLFSYEARRDIPGQIITEKATVAGFHVLAVARFVEMLRYSWDVGFGWYALGDETVPGLMTNLNYVLLSNSRFSVPVGARFNVVLNEPAIAATAMAKIGVSIPLSRPVHAPTAR